MANDRAERAFAKFAREARGGGVVIIRGIINSRVTYSGRTIKFITTYGAVITTNERRPSSRAPDLLQHL